MVERQSELEERQIDVRSEKPHQGIGVDTLNRKTLDELSGIIATKQLLIMRIESNLKCLSRPSLAQIIDPVAKRESAILAYQAEPV